MIIFNLVNLTIGSLVVAGMIAVHAIYETIKEDLKGFVEGAKYVAMVILSITAMCFLGAAVKHVIDLMLS